MPLHNPELGTKATLLPAPKKPSKQPGPAQESVTHPAAGDQKPRGAVP